MKDVISDTAPTFTAETSAMYIPPLRVLIPATILLWMAIALFNTGIFIFSFEDGEPVYDFFYGFRWTPLYHSPWLIFIPGILFLARKFPLNLEARLKNYFIHLLSAFIVTAASSLLHTYFIALRVEEPLQLSNLIGNFLFYSVDRLLIYFVILLGYYTIDYFRKQNEESLKELQLQEKVNRQKFNSFKNHIQPGFLLNTLKEIENMVLSSPARAEQLIADLAQKIRKMLKNSQKEVVSSHDDLSFLKSYISILSTRFEKDIRVKVFKEEKERELGISLFVINIIEQLLDWDEKMFQSFDTIVYEGFEMGQSYVIKAHLKRLFPLDHGHRRWFKKERLDLLARPFSESLEGRGSASLNYIEDGTLTFTVSLANKP